jgi:iron-sulfur cluster assembly accessory protein
MDTAQEEKIHPEMTIEDILTRYPQKAQKLAQEITNAGLHCVGCHAATWETLEGGMLGHGMTLEQVHALVGRLNAVLAEEQDLTAITITPRAAAKFLSILAEEKKQGYGLRLGLVPGGCSGYEYLLDFSPKAEASDEVFHSNGVQVHISKAHVGKLLGCEVDYVEGLQRAGFKISNPNVKSSCGCGSSQGY